MTSEIRTQVNNEGLVSQKRAQITLCAIKVFFEKGYDGTTTKELAKTCGMSEGALYRYIGTKADILHLICTFTHNISRVLQDYRATLGNEVGPTEVLCRCIEKYFRTEDESADLVIFFGREIHKFSHEDRLIILQTQIEVAEFFEKLLIEGITAGEFKVTNPLLLGHDILMRGQDYALRRWFLKKKFTFQEYTENYIEIILKCASVDQAKLRKQGLMSDTGTGYSWYSLAESDSVEKRKIV